MSGEATRFFVGRGGRWVPDPLTDEIRAALGEERARDLDHLATLAGEDVLGWPDDILNSQPEPFADFDAEQATRSLAWERRTHEAWKQTLQAEEEVAVLKGLLRTDPSPELERRLREANQHADEIEASRERLYDEMDNAGGFYLRDSFTAYPHLPYDRQPLKALVRGVAMARERAIRDAARSPLDEPATGGLVDASTVAAGGPAPQYREVGTGNLAEILERQRAAKARSYGVLGRGATASISLAELRRLVGDQRYETLATRGEDLARCLRAQVDEFVRERAAELGRPDQDMPRDAATHERRLAYALANAKLERDVASEEAVHETDPKLAAVAQQTADHAERTIARLEQELAPHSERLDTWVNSDDTVRRIAYTDAAAELHAVNVAQHVALSQDDPPKHLVDLIGPPDPDPTARIVVQHVALARDDPAQHLDDLITPRDPDRPEVGWESIALRVENLRLSGQFDPHRGASAHSLVEQLPAQLQHDINDLRERIGMEPLQTTTPHVAVESAGLDMG